MTNLELMESILCQKNLSSFDPYDIWKTDIGIKTRKLFYSNRLLGVVPAAILIFYDLYINNKFRIGYKKQEFPIVRSQAVLCLINLFNNSNNDIYLIYAKSHVNWLLANHSIGYKGMCWGLNFNWVYSAEESYEANTPFSTHTPYALEALVEFYNITNDENLLGPIKSVYEFLEHDLKIMGEDETLLIISYGPRKDRIVTNANSYVMYMYALLLPFFPNEAIRIKNKILKIYNFIISVQKENGSWLYSPFIDNSFIDCFHSCFILKNIYKTAKSVKLDSSNIVVEKGYKFLLDNFLDREKNLFTRFSISNKPSYTKFDLYDNAEMLNLASILQDQVTVDKLSIAIQLNFRKKDNIYSLIDFFGFRKNSNLLRWATMPYLLTLSNIK